MQVCLSVQGVTGEAQVCATGKGVKFLKYLKVVGTRPSKMVGNMTLIINIELYQNRKQIRENIVWSAVNA